MVFGGENNGTDDGSYLLFHNETHHKTNPTIIVQLNGTFTALNKIETERSGQKKKEKRGAPNTVPSNLLPRRYKN